MFSFVAGKVVQAEVVSSVWRSDRTCVYQI